MKKRKRKRSQPSEFDRATQFLDQDLLYGTCCTGCTVDTEQNTVYRIHSTLVQYVHYCLLRVLLSEIQGRSISE